MESSTFLTIIVALIAASPGLFAIWEQRRRTRSDSKKTDADATETWQNIATRTAAQYDDMCQRVDRMEVKVARLKKTIDTWRVGIGKLIQQIVDLDHVPVWQPSLEDDESEAEG